MSAAQSLVTWSDEFSLGMPEVDAQHKALIDLINRVWISLVKKANHEQTLKIVEELEKYTLTHFTVEEIFMREIAYSQFDEHKKEHEKFVARIAQEKMKIVAGHPVTLDMLHFLRDWLINHILVSDKRYAEEYKKRSGSSSILGKFFKRFWK